jgi:potassium/chloride transporter 9
MDKEALWYNMFVMQDAVCLQSLYDAARCKMQYFVVLGVATACLSTSLGSMFGSARILQAISRDGLVPGPKSLNEFFAVGTQKGDEPRRAVILTYIIAAAGVFIGGLDAVAPILTNFFLLTYSLTNAATALLAVAGALWPQPCPYSRLWFTLGHGAAAGLVNFRPGFRYYSWHTATVGAIVNLVVMFYLDVIYGSITLAIVIVVFIYIALRGPDTGWGDISQVRYPD